MSAATQDGESRAAPTGLQASASGSVVSLSWTAATGVTYYLVLRGTVSGGEVLIAAISTNSYSDTVAPGTYFYKVQAVGGRLSAEVSVTVVNTLLVNLLAWWTLDEVTSKPRADSSSNGNTMSESGGTVGSVAGLIGNAAQFTGAGSHFLLGGAQIGAVATEDFSCSCWVNPSVNPGSGVLYAWCVQSFLGVQRSGLTQFNNSGVQNVRFFCGNATIDFAKTLDTSAWTHLCGVRTGNTGKLYINGVYQATATVGNGTAATFASLGATSNGGSPCNGLLDLTGWWSKALTDGGAVLSGTAGGEVATLFNAGIGKDYPFA